MNVDRVRDLAAGSGATDRSEAGGEQAGEGASTDEAVSRLREGFFTTDLDGENCTVVTQALETLVKDDRAEAIEILEDRFESVCERQRPVLGGGPHPAACHLYDQPVEGPNTNAAESTADDD